MANEGKINYGYSSQENDRQDDQEIDQIQIACHEETRHHSQERCDENGGQRCGQTCLQAHSPQGGGQEGRNRQARRQKGRCAETAGGQEGRCQAGGEEGSRLPGSAEKSRDEEGFRCPESGAEISPSDGIETEKGLPQEDRHGNDGKTSRNRQNRQETRENAIT
ncbi:hypothetical protein [Aquisalinus flavus]|uniref:hypothetical protein n=1 Tax=Aquisalinus flavus TaxID=1526572 RepID=UPI0019D6FC5E|nr:hypothetical protein [Aquisalinus flavus]